MPVHTRVMIAVLAAALVVAACGNRTGDDADAAPSGNGSTTEPTDTTDGGSGGGATDIGVTGDTITIGVVADLTGVVPGLFKAAPDAVKAYAAKVNAEGGINGRQLVVEVYDTGTRPRSSSACSVPATATRRSGCSRTGRTTSTSWCTARSSWPASASRCRASS